MNLLPANIEGQKLEIHIQISHIIQKLNECIFLILNNNFFLVSYVGYRLSMTSLRVLEPTLIAFLRYILQMGLYININKFNFVTYKII